VDGFASLDARHDGGRVTTKPFVVRGAELRVNAKADFGSLAAELLDVNAKPISGFTRDKCQPMTVDSIEHTMAWRGGPSLAALRARPIQLRFYLKNARLYSYRVV
jgi:hypothetical protein